MCGTRTHPLWRSRTPSCIGMLGRRLVACGQRSWSIRGSTVMSKCVQILSSVVDSDANYFQPLGCKKRAPSQSPGYTQFFVRLGCYLFVTHYKGHTGNKLVHFLHHDKMHDSMCMRGDRPPPPPPPKSGDGVACQNWVKWSKPPPPFRKDWPPPIRGVRTLITGRRSRRSL